MADWVPHRVTFTRSEDTYNVSATLINMVLAKKIMRLFSERGYAHRVLCGRVYGVMRNRLGMAAPMLTEDRRVLEQIIFPHYANNSRIHTVLFVGCDSYTAHYGRRYFAGHNYWTLDPDATRRRFAAKQHVTARLQDVGRYFPHAFFDLIVFNGVYGWGLDSVQDCEAALSQCHRCLGDGGHLIIGWNDLPERDPAPLSEVSSLSRFSKYAFPAFGGWQYLTQTVYRHTYRFYQKTERGCTAGCPDLDRETMPQV